MHDVVIYEIVCDSNLFLDMGIISDKSRRVLQILPDLAGENIMVPNFGSQFCSPKTVQLVAVGSSPKNQFSGAFPCWLRFRVPGIQGESRHPAIRVPVMSDFWARTEIF